MTAPLTLPLASERRKPSPDPFAGVGDLTPTSEHEDPFQRIGDVAASPVIERRLFANLPEAERKVHLDRMLRAETANDAVPSLREQLVAGGKSAFEAVRHPIEMVKGMARSAAEDAMTVGGLMDVSESAGTEHPSPLTPELLEKGPRALLNTSANLLLPIAPVATAGIRPAINATLGAVNDPEQPVRGATAGLLIGEGLHRAPEVIPRRVKPPPNRMAEASQGSAAAAFWQNLDQGAKEQTSRGVEPVAGYEATAAPKLVGVPKKRAPEGLQTDPFADLRDVEPALPKQKPLDVERPTDIPGQMADEHYRALDARTEELNRQAALRALTGVRRRPGGVKPEPPQPDAPPAAPPPPPLEPAPAPEDVAASSAPAPAEPPPAYPEGFAMGGAEARIPPDFAPPRVPRSEPPPVPEGATAETARSALELPANPYRAHSTEQLAEAALDVQHAIEEAQRNLQMDGEASMKANESTGESVSDQAPLYLNKGQTLARAVARMAKIEREFAIRGLTGDDLADVMQAARERRLEREGQLQDTHLAMQMGEDPFATPAEPPPPPAATDRPAVPVDEPLPVGTPRETKGPLLNPNTFAEELRPGLSAAERSLTAKGIGKSRVTFGEQRAHAQRFRQELAADLGLSVLDFKSDVNLTGAQIVALKEKAGEYMDKITALDKQLADPSLPEHRRAAINTFREDAAGARDRLLESVIRATSQKGRDLGFLRQVAQRTLDPDVWMLHAKKALGDLPLTDDIVENLTKLVREATDACGGGA